MKLTQVNIYYITLIMGICVACEHNLICDKDNTKSVASPETTTKSPYTAVKFQSSSDIETSVHIHQQSPYMNHYNTNCNSNSNNRNNKVSITSVIQSNQLNKSNGPIIKHLRQKSSNKVLNFNIKVQ